MSKKCILKNNNKKIIVPLIYDFILFEVLTDVNNKRYTSYLISELLDLDYNYVLNNMVVTSSRHRIHNMKSKRVVSDIVIKVGNNIINIEGNKDYYDGVLEKSHYYFCKLISNSLKINDSYRKIPRITQINLNNFCVNKNVKPINEYLSIEKDNHDIELPMFKKIHINLDKIKNKWYNNCNLTKLEKYLLIFIIDDSDELRKIAKNDKILEGIVKRIMEINENYEEWIRVYDIVEENKRICNTMLENAKEKVAQANEKAKEADEKAKEADEKVKLANAKVKQINKSTNIKIENKVFVIISNLLEQNVEVDLISKATGVSKRKITELKLMLNSTF